MAEMKVEKNAIGACVILLRIVFTGELSACRIKMVKRPFTARALTVIPLAKFAFVIITPTFVYETNHFSVLLLTLTGFPLMITFCYDELFRNTVHIFCYFLFKWCFRLVFFKVDFKVHIRGAL